MPHVRYPRLYREYPLSKLHTIQVGPLRGNIDIQVSDKPLLSIAAYGGGKLGVTLSPGVVSIRARRRPLIHPLTIEIRLPSDTSISVYNVTGTVCIGEKFSGKLELSTRDTWVFADTVGELHGTLQDQSKGKIETVHGQTEIALMGAGQLTLGAAIGAIGIATYDSGHCRIKGGTSASMHALSKGGGVIIHDGQVSGNVVPEVFGTGYIVVNRRKYFKSDK